MTNFINSVSDWFANLPWWGWVLIVLSVLIFAAIVTPDPVEVEKDSNYPANWDDTITCTVPWQKPIILRPDEFHSYEEAYSGIWEVTLRNGNLIYLPMEYTTILDNSMELTTL